MIFLLLRHDAAWPQVDLLQPRNHHYGEDRLKKKWIENDADIPEETLIQLSEFNEIQMRLLYQRGLTTAAEVNSYLNPTLDELAPPESVYGIMDAVQRIDTACRRGEAICIYGDYDADGITAVSILVHTLRRIHGSVSFFLPERSDGYGLNSDALKRIHKTGVGLVIAVDCGIRAVEEAAEARKMGMDLIILDHHLPADTLPKDVIIVDPKVHSRDGAFTEYCGAALAYLLASEVLKASGETISDDMLALAAVGTIADMVPLVSENRILAAAGIQALRNTKLTGMLALYSTAGVSRNNITSSTVGYVIAPRLNAAGRIDSASIAVDLLLETDPNRAGELASTLEAVNTQRRALTKNTIGTARKHLAAMEETPPVIFIVDDSFHEGVVGLAASRLNDDYYRPVIVGAVGERYTTASARSIKELNIIQLLTEVEHCMVRYGGHAGAAGLTIENSRLVEFENEVLEVGSRMMSGMELCPSLDISCVIGFDSLNEELLFFMERIEPFGIGNQKPLFAARNVSVLSARAVGSGKEHLKLTLQQGDRFFDAIAFKQAHHLEKLQGPIDIAFKFEWNDYMGIRKMQLVIEDIIC